MKNLPIYVLVLMFLLPAFFRPFYDPESMPFIELILGVTSLIAVVELGKRAINKFKKKDK